MSGQSTSDDKSQAPAAEPTTAAAADAGPVAGEPGSIPEPGAPAPDAMIAVLEGQIADLTDRLLRTHAEMDNMRKRAEKERSDTQKYAVTKFANDVLAVGDNLQRAISAVPPGMLETDGALRGLLDGVTMTEREFLNVLSRHGVRRVDPKGEAFNPHLHQAVMEQQSTDVPAGTVLQVFQPGYIIEDRVLRPAMVVVAKGGLKPVKTAAAAEPGQSQSPAEAASNGGPSETSDQAVPQPGGFGRRTAPPGGTAG